MHPSKLFGLKTFKHRKLFEGIENAWDALKNLSHYLHSLKLGIIESKPDNGAYLINPELISIGKGTVIEPGAYIKGPCVIGDNCTIRHGAYIRGTVLVGDNCVVGHTTELKHSILLDSAKAAHFAFIGDSILGSDVNLGAGVKCANLRLDGKPIIITIEGHKYETEMRKLGALIGDGCQVGCNSVLNPGTILGCHVLVHPLKSVSGYIPDKKTVS